MWPDPSRIVFAIGALAIACTGPSRVLTGATGGSAVQTEVRAAIGQEFELENRQAALVADVGLTIRFERVASDERCPVGDTCASQGDAVLVVTMHQPPNAPASLELHTDAQRGSDGEYLGFRLSVVRLEPRPVGEQPVPLARYVATLKVSH